MLMATCAGAPEKTLSIDTARAERASDLKIRIRSSSNQSLRSSFAAESCAPFAKAGFVPAHLAAAARVGSRILRTIDRLVILGSTLQFYPQPSVF
jgi:hypothetical protein